MTTLYVLIGLPGSGKSYWAQAYAEQIGAIVIASDTVRNEAAALGLNPRVGDAVFAEVARRARLQLQAGRSIILDATHYLRRYRRYAIQLARELHVTCVAIWFDAPLERALQRNHWRTGARFGDQCLPAQVIRDMAAHFEPPTPAEFDRVIKVIG